MLKQSRTCTIFFFDLDFRIWKKYEILTIGQLKPDDCAQNMDAAKLRSRCDHFLKLFSFCTSFVYMFFQSFGMDHVMTSGDSDNINNLLDFVARSCWCCIFANDEIWHKLRTDHVYMRSHVTRTLRLASWIMIALQKHADVEWNGPRNAHVCNCICINISYSLRACTACCCCCCFW